MSRFKQNPSPEYRAAVRMLKLLKGDTAQIYAEATHERLHEDFAAARKLKERKPGSHVCVYRLKGSRQCRCYRIEDGVLRHQPIEIPEGDHLSEWTQGGRTVAILSQPYGLTFNGLRETFEFCEAHDLKVSINSYPSFHYPGVVLSLLFTRNGS